jgi:hypothetical protein
MGSSFPWAALAQTGGPAFRTRGAEVVRHTRETDTVTAR